MNAYWPDGLKPKRATLCPLDRSLGLVSILWSGHIVHKREVFKRMKRNLLIEFSYNFLWFVFSKENNGRIVKENYSEENSRFLFVSFFKRLRRSFGLAFSLFLTFPLERKREETKCKEGNDQPQERKETLRSNAFSFYFLLCIWSSFFLSFMRLINFFLKNNNFLWSICGHIIKKTRAHRWQKINF